MTLTLTDYYGHDGLFVMVEHDYPEEASQLWVQAEVRMHDRSLECVED